MYYQGRLAAVPILNLFTAPCSIATSQNKAKSKLNYHLDHFGCYTVFNELDKENRIEELLAIF